MSAPTPDPLSGKTGAAVTLDVTQIMTLLPHRPPMLLIDCLTDIVRGESARGLKNLGPGDSVFAGHFPGHPVMPGVLIVEAMAQTAGALVMFSLDKAAGDRVVYFMTIDKARFRRPVVPGDFLELKVKLQRARGSVWRFSGEAYVAGHLCAEAEYSAMIVENVGHQKKGEGATHE